MIPYTIIIAFKNIFRDKRRTFTLGSQLLFLVFALTGDARKNRKNITENLIASSAGHVTI